MKNESNNYITVAEAIRFSLDETTGEMYLTFRVTDPSLKRRTEQDWSHDEVFEIIGKQLKKKVL